MAYQILLSDLNECVKPKDYIDLITKADLFLTEAKITKKQHIEILAKMPDDIINRLGTKNTGSQHLGTKYPKSIEQLEEKSKEIELLSREQKRLENEYKQKYEQWEKRGIELEKLKQEIANIKNTITQKLR